MLWFSLLLPELPLQVFVRGFVRGAGETGALAVVERRGRECIIAANAAAHARGVAPGITLAGALAIAPDLLVRHRDEAAERAFLEELANWAGQFTSCVSIDGADALALEVGSSLRLFGGAPALAARIRQGAAALGLDVHLAAAPTPLAARWLAMTRSAHPRTDGLAGADSVAAAAPDWWRRLDALPLGVLAAGGVGQATLDLLEGIGLQRIGEAARLPRDALARRQAAQVLEALARARGTAPDPRRWHVPPERFECRLALTAPARTVETLLFACARLVASLAGWLGALQAGVDRCALALEHEHAPDTVLEIVTGKPGRDSERFLVLMREHLAVLTLVAPVEALRLAADKPVAEPGRSGDLFGDPGAVRDSAALLLGRLRARLGMEAVYALGIRPDHRPERAWRVSEPGATDTAGAAAMPPRPTWLLREPRALGPIRDLTLVSGPERIESGWWDGSDVRRDYYVARAPRAGLWWIFERLDPPGGWYVHGYFG